MVIPKLPGALAATVLVAACAAGPKPSPEHFANAQAYGTAAPALKSGGKGPPLAGTPSIDIELPQGLSELVTLYRTTLVHNAHHLSPEQARQFADLETARLTRQHGNDEAALRAALIKELRPKRSAPPAPDRPIKDSDFPLEGAAP